MDEPLSYDASPKKLVPKITQDLVIDHIIDSFGAGSEGIICDVHLAIADSHPNRTRSEECKYLAGLFSRAVDAPKTGEIIELDKVYELRAKYCRGYPLFMKKYDQPIRESQSILNKLFLAARHQFFKLQDPILPTLSPSQLLLRSQSATPKARGRRKPEIHPQDKEFQKWLLSCNTHGSENSTTESLPITTNGSMTKERKKVIDRHFQEPMIRLSGAKSKQRTTEVPSAEEEIAMEMTESNSTQASSAEGTKDLVNTISSRMISADSEKPKPTKKKVESTNASDTSQVLFNSAASSDTSKSSASASYFTDNIPRKDIVFDCMTAVTNRLRWNSLSSDSYTVDLDTTTHGEDNSTNKLVQLVLDLGKRSSLSDNSQLTLVISWGELHLKVSQIIDSNKPKNIKELHQQIEQSNNIDIVFRESDLKTVQEAHVSPIIIQPGICN